MKKYTVEISETKLRKIEVNAHSPEEALDIIQEDYADDKIILDVNDSIGAEIVVVDKRELTKIEKLRLQYPKGTKIRCIEMNDPYHPIPTGMIGEVEHVDDAGTIHMRWENGSSLGLVIGEDFFKKVEESTKEKSKNKMKER